MEVGRFKAVRHTMRLNSTMNVRPAIRGRQDFSSNFGLGFNNRFDLKYLSQETDSTLVEKKLDGVIDWSLNSSYNPQGLPGRQWQPISSGLTVKPGQSRYLKLKVSNSIDPYTLSLLSTRFTYGLSFGGRFDVGQVAEMEEPQRNAAIDALGVDLEQHAGFIFDSPCANPIEGLEGLVIGIEPIDLGPVTVGGTLGLGAFSFERPIEPPPTDPNAATTEIQKVFYGKIFAVIALLYFFESHISVLITCCHSTPLSLSFIGILKDTI